jgi:hypothetical protein
VIWVYAIADRPDLVPGAPLEAVTHDGVAAIFTRVEDAPSEPAPEALWAHEQVVEQLMADRAVLPMRFGTTLAGDDDLRGVLTERHDEFAAALDRVRGRVELGLRVMATGDPEPAPPPTSGRDYVLSKLASARAAADLHEPLAQLAVDARRQPARGGDEVLRAAYLVDHATVARFRSAVDDLARSRPDLALLCTGPWPPYAFVEAPAHEPVAR